MPRSRAFIVGAFVALLPLAASAALPVPAGVNLHNGYIEIVNHIQYRDGFSVPGIVNVNSKKEGEVGSSGTFVVNRCCILAGSHYEVELNYMQSAGLRIPDSVVPRLCNIRGIPFGYAVVEYTGWIAKTRERSESFASFKAFNLRARRVDDACPVER